MTVDERDQKAAIVLAGVERLGSLQGFPVHDYALVAETDLDLMEIRILLENDLARGRLAVAAGEQEGAVLVTGIAGGSAALPDLGIPGDS